MTSFAVLCVLVAVAINGGFADEPDRLISGEHTSHQQYPYVASVRFNGQHICGGSIIGEQQILTAAQCLVPFVEKIRQLTVVTGTNALNNTHPLLGKTHKVSNLFYHSKYNPDPEARDNSYDIGIIKLADKLQYNDNQRPIPLPDGNIRDDSIVSILGWGATSYPNGSLSRYLLKLQAMTINSNVCRTYHQKIQNITSLQFCTYRANGTGTCYGDSGSPVVYQYKIVGVVSMRNDIPCGVGLPDVMTNVYKLLDFVKATLKK